MIRSRRVPLIIAGALSLGLIMAVCIRAANTASGRQGMPVTPKADRFAYHSASFTRFITESDDWCKSPKPTDFYGWMESAYASCGHKFPGKEQMTLEELLKTKREQFARVTNPFTRAENEIAFSAWVHRMVKTIIPRFSLDRGFEFANVPRRGERQCLLQSVLISGLLQSVGFDSGVAMVYRNPRGEESNNGHAVTLLKLSDGRDILVDASHAEPFYKPQGIFIKDSEYRFVNPGYLKDSARIRYYLRQSGDEAISTRDARPLDYGFVRSQFWYYRGERAKGAFFYTRQTPQGWAEAQKALEQSVRYCSKNPLAVYMLGRAYYAQGQRQKAKETFKSAATLYARFGWTYPDVKRYYRITSEQ